MNDDVIFHRERIGQWAAFLYVFISNLEHKPAPAQVSCSASVTMAMYPGEKGKPAL